MPRHFPVLLMCALLIGCFDQASKKTEPTPQVSSKDRPPLQVWLVDAPELEKEIFIRWQTASDQSIEIKNVKETDLSTPPYQVDVVIFPGSMIGDLVRNEVIGKLPAQVLKGGSSQPSDAVSPWPIRWRNIASYGSQVFAIPLGAPSLGAVTSHVTSPGLSEMNAALQAAKLDTATAVAAWDKSLVSMEKYLSNTPWKSDLSSRLSSLNEMQKSDLVDRYLWIAATTDARRKGLFDLVKMQSRLHQSEFVESAKILTRLARLNPAGFFDEPTKAWSSIADDSSHLLVFAIGYPGSSNEPAPSVDHNALKVAPLLWNAEHGLIASVGKNTRQSSVSSQFLIWLHGEEQRAAIRPICPRIELLPTQFDGNASQSLYRDYQNLQQQPHQQSSMDLSLRFAHGSKYRTVLASHLIEILANPDRAQEIMAHCSNEWNQLTDNLDKDKQRLSIEQSLGFQK